MQGLASQLVVLNSTYCIYLHTICTFSIKISPPKLGYMSCMGKLIFLLWNKSRETLQQDGCCASPSSSLREGGGQSSPFRIKATVLTLSQSQLLVRIPCIQPWLEKSGFLHSVYPKQGACLIWSVWYVRKYVNSIEFSWGFAKYSSYWKNSYTS